MSVTIDKLVLDAKRISNRLNDKVILGDSLINEIEFINEQLKTLKSVHEKFDVLNELSRNKPNQNLANSIQKKYPHIQEIQYENRELRACLQDYQRTMEHVMTKYREHIQQQIANSKFTFSSHSLSNENKYDQISNMADVMRRAAEIDEDKEFAQMELINKLVIENKGLKEMLQISKEFGSDLPVSIENSQEDTEKQKDLSVPIENSQEDTEKQKDLSVSIENSQEDTEKQKDLSVSIENSQEDTEKQKDLSVSIENSQEDTEKQNDEENESEANITVAS